MDETDVSMEYPGLVHDARVLNKSPIFYHALSPPAAYLLPNGAHPCLEAPIGILTPYKHRA